MAYTPYTWQNLPNVTTPISKANLDHLETQYTEAASDDVTHAALDTGVHGAGASTLATAADIVIHAALDTGVHGAGASTLATAADIAALTQTMLCFTSDNGIAAGTTVFLALGTGNSSVTEIPSLQFMITKAGTLSTMYIKTEGDPGAGDTFIFTLRKNGGDESITVTISDAETTGNDTVNTEAVVAGDLISIKCVASATADNSNGVSVGVLLKGA